MDKASSTVDLPAAAIVAEGQRQKAIAGNFANLETSGYRRVDVKTSRKFLSKNRVVILEHLKQQNRWD